MLGMDANGPPKVNTPGFVLCSTNAPHNSLGLGLITDSQDLAGSDPFGIGIELQVDFFAATQVLSFDITSDPGGSGAAATPIPNNSNLAGGSFYAQTVWIEDVADGQATGPSPFHLVSSIGMKMTIQP